MSELPTIRVLQFKTDYVRRNGASVPVEMVEYAPISAIMTNRVWARVEHLRPREHLANDEDGKKGAFMRHRWTMIEPAYNAWKAGQELPTHGTPLGVWPALTPEQAEAFRRFGLRTVEEVAAITDTVIGKLNLPNARELPKQAQLFLDNTGRAAEAEKMAARDAKIAELEERLAAAMELLEETTKGKRKAAA